MQETLGYPRRKTIVEMFMFSSHEAICGDSACADQENYSRGVRRIIQFARWGGETYFRDFYYVNLESLTFQRGARTPETPLETRMMSLIAGGRSD